MCNQPLTLDSSSSGKLTFSISIVLLSFPPDAAVLFPAARRGRAGVLVVGDVRLQVRGGGGGLTYT